MSCDYEFSVSGDDYEELNAAALTEAGRLYGDTEFRTSMTVHKDNRFDSSTEYIAHVHAYELADFND